MFSCVLISLAAYMMTHDFIRKEDHTPVESHHQNIFTVIYYCSEGKDVL